MAVMGRQSTWVFAYLGVLATVASGAVWPWSDAQSKVLFDSPKTCMLINNTPWNLKLQEQFWSTGQYVKGGEPPEAIPGKTWGAWGMKHKEWFQGIVGGLKYSLETPKDGSLNISMAWSEPVIGHDKTGLAFNRSIWEAYEAASNSPYEVVGPVVQPELDGDKNETLLFWASGDTKAWCTVMVGFHKEVTAEEAEEAASEE